MLLCDTYIKNNFHWKKPIYGGSVLLDYFLLVKNIDSTFAFVVQHFVTC